MRSDSPRDPSESESDDDLIAQRIARIEDSLKKESWLPHSLRGMLATELPQLLLAVRGGGRFWRDRVAKKVLALALATWIYGPSPLESETISKLRALDLELNSSEIQKFHDDDDASD